jgi:hypothetical protein
MTNAVPIFMYHHLGTRPDGRGSPVLHHPPRPSGSSSVQRWVAMDPPMIRRLNASTTTARYTNPAR